MFSLGISIKTVISVERQMVSLVSYTFDNVQCAF